MGLSIALVCALSLLPGGVRASFDEAALPHVGDGLSELVQAFSDADGRARVVVVTSERSPASRKCMRAFRSEVLSAITSPDLTVLVVWVPQKNSDPEQKAVREARRVAEPRLSPFWAGEPDALDPWRASLAQTSSIAPDSMPRSGLFAVYPAGARWEGAPPTPSFWTHSDKKLKNDHRAFDLEALTAAITDQLTPEPEDVASIPTERRAPAKNSLEEYFLHGPMKPGMKPPTKGHPLLVVLPGGSGSAEFRAFVKRIGKNSTGNDWLVAQLVSRMWTPEQKMIWPTLKNKVSGQKFATEEYLDGVLADVCAARKIDRSRIVVLGWSSSGPALYAHALRAKPGPVPITRYLIAMSVFRPERLPPIQSVKGKRFFLYHSREDQKCAFGDAERAVSLLGGAGATLDLVEYAGGHGWQGNMFGDLRKGVDWLLRE